MRQYKVFVQASSFQRIHVEQCEHQDVHPSCAFVAKTITFSDDTEPPADLLQAAEWAADAQENDSTVPVPEGTAIEVQIAGPELADDDEGIG